MSREIIITCGIPASGKTSFVQPYLNQPNVIRLNRDTLGGTLEGIAVKLDTELKKDKSGTFVLDNTYPTKELRRRILEVGKKHKVPVTCLWLQTSLEDAQFNAATRMVRKYGKLLSPEEIKANGKKDPNCFQVGVLFQYRKNFQEPTIDEGFASIEEISFLRVDPPYTNKALILDYDGTLRETKSGEHYPRTIEDIKILPNRSAVIKNYQEKGYILVGVSNQSGIDKGSISLEHAVACFEETNKQLGIEIDYRFCPHRSHPIVCYCRKPGTGLGAELIETYKLNRKECIMVGDMTTDKTFANRCGFKYFDAKEFFK